MLRTFACAVVALMLSFGTLLAEELKGKFVKFDAAKKELTVSVEGKDKTFKLADDVKVMAGKKAAKDPIKALEAAKAGSEWTLTVDGDKVTELKPAGKKAK